MTSEKQARRAAELLPQQLSDFEEFIGSGVTTLDNSQRDMAVAVYVSKPTKDLPRSLRAKIPDNIQLRVGQRTLLVRTKIVNLGVLTP